MSNTFQQRLASLVFVPTFACLAMLPTSAVEAQEARIREQQKALDLSGARNLTYSLDGEFVAGLKGSLVKIWSIKKKMLLHEFRVPGTAHAVVFSPDASTLVAADGVGNLGWETTIRAWEIADGTERKIGSCTGGVEGFCFSPDGSRLAATRRISPIEAMGLHHQTKVACFGQIEVWKVADERKLLSINIAPPRPEAARHWWHETDPKEKMRIHEACRRMVPTRISFSPDGKQLVGETDAGYLTIHDSRTGEAQPITNTSSVGMFLAMLMIALHEVPAEVTDFTVTSERNPSPERGIELTENSVPRSRVGYPLDLQSGGPLLFGRQANGWWQAFRREKAQPGLFRIDGQSFVTNDGGIESRTDVRTLLGLVPNINLAELESVEHPLGAITIVRNRTGLEVRLEEKKNGMATGRILQAGAVRWVSSPKE